MLPRRPAVLALVLLGAGCGVGADDPPSAQEMVTYDSAGARVVVNPGDEAAEPPATWEVVEAVRVGSLDGPQETIFERIGDVVPDGDGGVYVAEMGENVVRRYDAGGAFRTGLGGEGEGPGEFTGLTDLAHHGDTLWAFDARRRRVTVFSRDDGRLLRTHGIDFDFVEQGFPRDFIPLAEERSLLQAGMGCRMPRPEDPRPRRFLNHVPDRSAEAAALQVEGPVASWLDPGALAIYGETFCTSIPALGGHTPSLAVSGGGVAALVPGPEYEIHVFDVPIDPDGWGGGDLPGFPPPELVVRRDVDRRTIRVEEENEYRETALGLGGELSDDRDEAVRAAWDTTGVPERYPALREVRWDDEGNLWALRREPYEGALLERPGETRWDVFAPDGAWIGRVEVPEGLEIRLVHDGRIWGVEHDELDVPYLVGLDVRRVNAGPSP